MILIYFAVIFDFLDGKIAKWLKQTNEFGKELDSFSDLVSFRVWPMIFGYILGFNSLLELVVIVFFSTCTLLRLARFNTTKIIGYEGVPTTTNGLLFPILYLIFYFQNISFDNLMVLGVYFLMGILMVSKIKIKKI